MDQCGLLGGLQYDFQIRCIRKNLTGQWSEWGPATSVTTVETGTFCYLQQIDINKLLYILVS